jgi:hypothetical protein
MIDLPCLLASISIADRYEMMDSRDDVECEPDARHDDCPSMIVRRKAVSPDPGLIECGDITAVLDRYRSSPLWLIGAFSVQR